MRNIKTIRRRKEAFEKEQCPSVYGLSFHQSSF